MTDQLSHEGLRALVREVLREALPQARSETATDGEVVAIRSDADLDAFVRHVLLLAEDPQQRAAVLDGTIRFRLAVPTPEQPPTPPVDDNIMRIDHGAVTERRIQEAARSGSSIVVGRAAVLTPLAHDRARALGVTIEKEHR